MKLFCQGGLRRKHVAFLSESTRFNRTVAIAPDRTGQALVDQASGKIKGDVIGDRVIEPEAAQYPAPAHDCE